MRKEIAGHGASLIAAFYHTVKILTNAFDRLLRKPIARLVACLIAVTLVVVFAYVTTVTLPLLLMYNPWTVVAWLIVVPVLLLYSIKKKG